MKGVICIAHEENIAPHRWDSESARIAQKKSAKAKREKGNIALKMKTMLDSPIKDPNQIAMIERSGLPMPKKPTYADLLAAQVVMRIIKSGSLRDVVRIMAMTGQGFLIPEEPAVQKDNGFMDAINGCAQSVFSDEEENNGTDS